MMQSKNIILLGMKHAGKTTVGKHLAKSLSRPFLDTDDCIRDLSGKTPRELWNTAGAPLVMHWEKEACANILKTYPCDNPDNAYCVLATGGGIADNEEACALLARTGILLYLETKPEILFERIQKSAQRDGCLPPFLEGGDPQTLFNELFSRRTPIYAKIAQVSVETGRSSPQQISQKILDLLKNG